MARSKHNRFRHHNRDRHASTAIAAEHNRKLNKIHKGSRESRPSSGVSTTGRRPMGPGLINGHNTCFMNSVLQCLTYTPVFSSFLLNGHHGKVCQVSGFCALCVMEQHVQRVFLAAEKGIKSAIYPKYFTSNLKALSKTLRLGRQEDSHEFLTFLLSAFQKALLHGKRNVNGKAEEDTVIHSIFGGRLQSQVECKSCHAKSNTIEPLLDLSVDVDGAVTLEDALKSFTKADKIGGDDPSSMYTCSACHQKVKATKQMTIAKLPVSLNLHLKRFTFDMYYGDMRKVRTKIRFPDELDMAPFLSPKARKLHNGKVSYNLHGVLVHFGHSCSSGHYICYVKNKYGDWYRMDDEEVIPVSQKEVFAQQAYMLFYTQSDKNVSKVASSAASSDASTATSQTTSQATSRTGPTKEPVSTPTPVTKANKAPSIPNGISLDVPANNGIPVVTAASNTLKRKRQAETASSESQPKRVAKTQVHFVRGTPERVLATRPGDWLISTSPNATHAPSTRVPLPSRKHRAWKRKASHWNVEMTQSM